MAKYSEYILLYQMYKKYVCEYVISMLLMACAFTHSIFQFKTVDSGRARVKIIIVIAT